jgi:phthiocerol/phenolphthiocerol synthesis type-I polyketide synthase E
MRSQARGLKDTVSNTHSDDTPTGLEIAVIGMAGRFPGAADIDSYWRNLCEGRESLTRFSDEQLRAAGISAARLAEPDYVKVGGVLDGVEDFDAAFFGYSPREAASIDPQQRVFLETAWSALENAGYDATRSGAGIGVYAGVGRNTYLTEHVFADIHDAEQRLWHPAVIGNDKDFLATRVSYKLNLEGPSVVVQTACSTSLVAIHVATQALLGGECDMALAGGATIRLPQLAGYHYQEDGILAPDGHCRAFDAAASGCVPGNGVGVVVLKRLADALADGDTIHAVIKGTAINNDGAGKAGYTAPRIDGQAAVIRAAQRVADVAPTSIDYF